MAYVAVSGGKEAIEASIRLLDLYKSGTDKDIETEAIENKLSLLVDRVMSEAGLYSKAYAALALKQCEGSVEEAVFLLRAYRSTLARNYYTDIVDTEAMRVVRRISAAFKDITGGQMLGASYDYTHRLIDFGNGGANPAGLRKAMLDEIAAQTPEEAAQYPRVSDALKDEGLIDRSEQDDQKPHDVTAHMLEFPAERSARLQTLSRADTGFISGVAYSALRGFGQVHPTVGELRCGYAELYVPYGPSGMGEPGNPGNPGGSGENESIYIGEILITEVECFNSAEDNHPRASRHPSAEGNRLKLAVGYGAVFGRNENKAIAMAVIDHELNAGGPYPAQNEEFVLTHGDSLEMNGFVSHLKLPHYVTFQSKLDAVRRTRE
ncbi:MAG: carbon-phosphorus lyase complex subunit PhnI [Oscillospiraceae bacterium]|jgi:alpha-D-ribose 1-methylphosphonate 5-triphosphate synthase subunit PhnI|nr:carbon-phosphorus lyase complex subunit PhnI [Oscillospiraceae bacterium]